MALQLWMPLRGNLDNLGLADVGFVADSTATVSNNGKIGKCYQFQGYSGYGIHLTSGMTAALFMDSYINNHSFSISCWVKTSSTSTCICSLTYGIRLFAGNLTSFGIYTVESSNNIYTFSYGAKSNDNKWHHIVGVYDSEANNITVYVDGIAGTTVAWSGAGTYSSYWTNGLYIGRDCNGSTLTNSYFFQGLMNDFRVYNHALSQAEVHSLSQGLVVHYKMDNEYIEGTTNISTQGNCSGWNNSGTSTRNNNDTSIPNIPELNGKTVSITQDTAGQSAITFGVTTMNVPSKTLTASVWFYMSGDITNAISPYIRSTKTDGDLGYLLYNESSSISNWPKNTWIKITKTITTNSEATTIYFCAYTAKAGCKFVFNGWQIEEKDHATPYTNNTRLNATSIQDHSGYQNNGQANNLSIDSYHIGRYNSSLYFNGNESSVTIDNFTPNSIFNESFTIVFWQYRTDTDRSIIFGNYNQIPYFNLEYTSSSVLRLYMGGDHDVTLSAIPNNELVHVAVVLDRSVNKVLVYKNGLLQSTTSHTYPIVDRPACTFRIGKDVRSDATQYKGYLSDFRIYSTALSSDDILSLYQLGARIDGKKNLHTFEIEENGLELPLKIQRNGVSVCNEFIESDNASIRLDGTTESNNIYEI